MSSNTDNLKASLKMVSRGPRNTKITWCHLWTLKSEIFESLSLELTEIWNLNVYEMEIKNFEFFYLPVQQGLSWVPDQNKYIWSCCWVPQGNISQPEPESKEERQERNKSLKDFSDDLFSAMLVEELSGKLCAKSALLSVSSAPELSTPVLSA